MSNLQNALKRAEQEREAAKRARAQSSPDAHSGHGVFPTPVSLPETPEAANIDIDPSRPAVMRSQRDAVRAWERLSPPAATPYLAAKSFRAMGIALILATLVAVGVGVSLRGRDADKAMAADANTTHAARGASGVSSAAPPLIPAALRASEAGPLQLRLDRSIDAVGNFEHRRNKLQ